ncbi:response regulator [Effusibacillus pohliae]|uniref:response regulator n=1 Tax=Effusibacillus pohliae TaxID=232270 RepID=UPI000376D16D|nr:response regulator [Effusibacillus pohliae]
MKVLICDDEQIERMALRQLLNRHLPELQVVAEAANGRQAILLADQHHPDIITMDIKMPGINGLETIQEIQSRHPHVRFLMISAYDTFDYAREAIQLGVKDYILKPSKKELILASFRKVMQDIERERAARQERLELLEQVAAMTPLAEQKRVEELLNDPAAHQLEADVPGDLRSGYVLTVWLDTTQRHDLQPILYDLLKMWGNVWVGPYRDGRMPVIIWKAGNRQAGTDAPPTGFLRSEVHALARKIKQRLPEQNVCLTVGRFASDPAQFPRSYRESLLVRRCMGQRQAIGFYEDHAADGGDPFVTVDPFIRQIIEQVKEGNEPEVAAAFSRMMQAVRRQSGDDWAAVRDTLLSFVAVVGHIFYDSCAIKAPSPLAVDGGVMQAQVEDYLQRLTAHWAELNRDRSKQAAALAMSYLQQRYAQDIRLEDVASHVGLSPSYFSRVFKEAYGVTFTDALTQIRMEEAKKRLQQGESVKAVALSVGYRDPNYFTRMFKKVTGRSPRAYREQKNPPSS